MVIDPQTLAIDDGSIQGVYLLWTLATSMSQLAFGYMGDRLRGGWLLWGGTAVGVVGMSAVGLVGTSTGLGALLVVSGNVLGRTQTATLYVHDGIESFHAEGAYAASVALAGVSFALLIGMEMVRKRALAREGRDAG